MDYLNVETAFIMSAEFRGCEPVDRATWLALAGFCALMENGGKIAGCRTWKPRRCEMTLGITAKEMHRACDLWSWEGDDLMVHFYPVAQEEIVQRKRGVARINGKLGGRPPKTDIGTEKGTDIGSDIGTHGEPKREPISEPKSESVKEGKEREGKEMETPPKAPKGAGSELTPFLEQVWNSGPATTRFRSSKVQLVKAWSATTAKPAEDVVTTALDQWCRSQAWLREDGQFAPAIHRWVQLRQWENLPTENPHKQAVKVDIGGRKPFGVMRMGESTEGPEIPEPTF